MTTTIIVQANHGWPVDVFAHDKPGEESKLLARVAPGASVAGCDGVHASVPSLGSLVVTPVSVTFPAFVAVRV